MDEERRGKDGGRSTERKSKEKGEGTTTYCFLDVSLLGMEEARSEGQRKKGVEAGFWCFVRRRQLQLILVRGN